jgi:hypothetical protein
LAIGFSAIFAAISASKSTCWSPPPFMSPHAAGGGGELGGPSLKSSSPRSASIGPASLIDPSGVSGDPPP